MIITLMVVSAMMLARGLTVVIFALTTEGSTAQSEVPKAARWSLVWFTLFMSFLYIHQLQTELDEYQSQEVGYVQD